MAKIADQVHCGLKQFQHVDFVVAARELGWTVCECEPEPRTATLADPKWRQQLHLRSTSGRPAGRAGATSLSATLAGVSSAAGGIQTPATVPTRCSFRP